MKKKIILAVFWAIIMCCALCSCNGNTVPYEKIISHITENGGDCDNLCPNYSGITKNPSLYGPTSDDYNIKGYGNIFIYNENKADEYDKILVRRDNLEFFNIGDKADQITDGTFYSTLTINTKTNEFEFNYRKANNMNLVYQIHGQADTFTSNTECDVYTYLDSDEVTFELTSFTKNEVNESLQNLLNEFEVSYEEEGLFSLDDLGFISYETPEDGSSYNIESLLESIDEWEDNKEIRDIEEEYKIDLAFGAAEDYKTTGNLSITSKVFEYLSDHGKISIFIFLDRAGYYVEDATIISAENKYTAELLDDDKGTLEWSLYKNGVKIYTYTDDSSKKTVQESNEDLEKIWEEIEKQNEAVSEKGEPCGSCGKKYEAGDSSGNYKNIAKTGMCKECYESFKSMSEWVKENQ